MVANLSARDRRHGAQERHRNGAANRDGREPVRTAGTPRRAVAVRLARICRQTVATVAADCRRGVTVPNLSAAWFQGALNALARAAQTARQIVRTRRPVGRRTVAADCRHGCHGEPVGGCPARTCHRSEPVTVGKNSVLPELSRTDKPNFPRTCRRAFRGVKIPLKATGRGFRPCFIGVLIILRENRGAK